MADDTDFVALYDELGLGAECSMADFKQAYRRRVGKLHPDLTGNPSDVSRLQRLNRLYAAALDFEHAHGRHAIADDDEFLFHDRRSIQAAAF